MNELSETDDPNGDGEGVWSPEIEKCFREALKLFPPCGRRKHIVQEEGAGKMYGRNELIARHIKRCTGQERTRKQVSSHIQVLARRRARAELATSRSGAESRNGSDDYEEANSSSPASSIAMSVGTLGSQGQQIDVNIIRQIQHHHHQQRSQNQQLKQVHVWADRPIATKRIRLVEFSAFIEFRRQLHLQPIAPTAVMNSPAFALASLASGSPISANGHPMPASVADREPNGLVSGSPYMAVSTALSQAQTTKHHPLNRNQLIVPGQFNHHQTHEIYPQGINASHLHQPLNNNHHHQQLMNQQIDQSDYMLSQNVSPFSLNYQQQATSASSGLTRHSYIKIDYRQPIRDQTSELEGIDISEIQDKFPEMVGSQGLYQRGPPDAFYVVKFWADMNIDYEHNIEDQNSFFGFSCSFETLEPFKHITCSTKTFSYGNPAVEKVDKIYGASDGSYGRYSYEVDRSPMCEYMIQFIKKLRQLPRASQMNSVLENFTVLQVVTSEATSEILLCLAFVFEVASKEHHNGSHYHVYRLTKRSDERSSRYPVDD